MTPCPKSVTLPNKEQVWLFRFFGHLVVADHKKADTVATHRHLAIGRHQQGTQYFAESHHSTDILY